MTHFDDQIRGDRLAEQMELGLDVGPITIVGVDKSRISDGYHTFGELYAHRDQLFITLCRKIELYEPGKYVWKSKLHSDGSSYPGYFILGIHAAGPQMTYHLPMALWDQVNFIPECPEAPKWDGHTPADVLDRLKTL